MNGGCIMDNRVSVKAVIDFAFKVDPEMSPAEMMAEFIDRIKSGEYFPEDLLNVALIPTA